MSDDQLVAVMVPSKHLAQVYGFIASLAGEEAKSPPKAKSESPAANGAMDEWTPTRLKKAIEQSPPAMRDILRALANKGGEWLTIEELASSIQGNEDATWNTVAGTLGAFGRRLKNRYGLETFPFEKRFDHASNCNIYQMSKDVAASVRDLLDKV